MCQIMGRTSKSVIMASACIRKRNMLCSIFGACPDLMYSIRLLWWDAALWHSVPTAQGKIVT